MYLLHKCFNKEAHDLEKSTDYNIKIAKEMQ